MTTIEQAHDYFVKRAQSLHIATDIINDLWRYTQNIILKAFVYIDDDYSTNAFLETTCNGILNVYEDGWWK